MGFGLIPGIYSRACNAKSFQSKQSTNAKRHFVWHLCGMRSLRKNEDSMKLGDEAPRLKDFVIVIVVVVVLTFLSLIVYKLGWLG